MHRCTVCQNEFEEHEIQEVCLRGGCANICFKCADHMIALDEFHNLEQDLRSGG